MKEEKSKFKNITDVREGESGGGEPERNYESWRGFEENEESVIVWHVVVS